MTKTSSRKSMTENLSETARTAASDAANAAKDQVTSSANTAKDTVAGEVDSVADAMRDASEDLMDGSPQERATGQAADTLDHAADMIRDIDLVELVDATTSFARRNPAMFLGGAALLGFALARFTKASGPGHSHGGSVHSSDGPSGPDTRSVAPTPEHARRPVHAPVGQDSPAGPTGRSHEDAA